jgi:hypothetical protein
MWRRDRSAVCDDLDTCTISLVEGQKMPQWSGPDPQKADGRGAVTQTNGHFGPSRKSVTSQTSSQTSSQSPRNAEARISAGFVSA